MNVTERSGAGNRAPDLLRVCKDKGNDEIVV